MTDYWTKRRKASLVIHVAFVLVPFILSTVSALLFWRAMFGGWLLAVPMVAVIEVLSLAGLVLFLTKIESPFVALRHLLPFISIVPLGRELYLHLYQNGPLVAWGLTIVATSILVAIAWQCFRTIERLFISPVEAAKEKAREQIGALSVTLAQLDEMNNIVDGFVVARMGYHAPSLTAARVAHTEPVTFGATQVLTETTKAHMYLCPNCENELSLGAYGAAKRHGHCKACKGA
jgi:hypothetical protein